MSDNKNLQTNRVAEDSMTDLWNVWYSELHEGLSGLTIKVDRVVESLESEFQRIDILDTKDFGRMLVLYGSLMACDNDYNSYNEMITHVPLFAHAAPKKVLIIGGGDCGALTEVTKHTEVDSVTMCEIDQKVVEVSQKYFSYLTTGLADPRATVVYGDGKKFIEESEEKFDIIILDLSDPVGPAVELFQKPFHQKVFDRLNDDGIMVAQSESPFYNAETVRQMHANLREIFPIVSMYYCFMPIYPSGIWSFAYCSKKYDAVKDFDQARYDSLNLTTRYYNDKVHHGAFMLPTPLLELTRDR